MFTVKVNGGYYHGQTVLSDGWIPFFANPMELSRLFGLSIAKFDDLADAQDFVVRKQNSVSAGDYGIGATLVIDEADGDIKYEW